MFILNAVVLGLLISFISGGSLINLAAVNLRRKWLALISFGIQLVLFSDLSYINSINKSIIIIFHFLTYIGLLIFVLLNIKIPGVAIIGSGIFLNFLVISLNGGYMPSTLQRVSTGDTHNNIVGMSDTSLLPWLGDVFHLPAWLPFSTAFSAGDVFIAVGVFLYLFLNMRPKKSNSHNA